MKITSKYSAIIELAIAIVLVVVCFKYSFLAYGSFSPIKAHESSERTFHYGPSKIIKTIDLKDQKIYLCRYKDWFSADTVNRGSISLIKWYPGDNVSGAPIDYSKQVSYYWSSSGNKDNISTMKLYGYVNDPNITTILLEEENGANQSRYDLDESRMFIFIWSEISQNLKTKYLRGLNKENKVIYEEKAFL